MKVVKDSTLTPIEKISLCYKHNLQREWVRDSFVTVCRRRGSLSSAEMAMIGHDFSAILAKAREDYFSGRKPIDGPFSEDEEFVISIAKELATHRYRSIIY
jgi:hypothetical protein